MTGMKTVRAGALLLAGTMLSGVPVMAQGAPATPAGATTQAAAPAATPGPQPDIKKLRGHGAERTEHATSGSCHGCGR